MNLLTTVSQLALLSNSSLGQISIQPQYGFTNLSDAVNTLLYVIFFFGSLAAFFYLLLGAFKYIIAGDDDNRLKGARATMMHAIVGLILLAMVTVIFQVLASIIPGLNQLITF